MFEGGDLTMENFYSNAIKIELKSSPKVAKESKSRVSQPDPFKIIAPILEGIIERIQNKTGEQVIAELYIGASQIWGDLDDWPKSIKSFYGKLNYKVSNPDNLSSVESRERGIIQAIKNKWLQTTGASFKGRFERLKQLGEKNIRDDGSKLNTKEVVVEKAKFNEEGIQVKEAKIKIVRRLEKKDYIIKGIESSSRAKRFKVNKEGNEEFVEFVK